MQRSNSLYSMKEELLNELYQYLSDCEERDQEVSVLLKRVLDRLEVIEGRLQNIESKVGRCFEGEVVREEERVVSEPVESEVTKDSRGLEVDDRVLEEEESFGELEESEVTGEELKGERVVKSVEDKSVRSSLVSLRNAFSIGDKFLFQRELFGGDGELFQKTLTLLDGMGGIDEVYEYLGRHFKWDKESDAYKLFTNALLRRFGN